MKQTLLSLVAILTMALPLTAQSYVDASMVGVVRGPSVAEQTVGDIAALFDDFGCTPCTSYAIVDIHFDANPGNWINVTLNTPGQSFVPDTDGHNYNLKFGLPSSQQVGWCNPNQPAQECTPMVPCAASYWGAWSGLGNGYSLTDMDSDDGTVRVNPSGPEEQVDCGDSAGFRHFEIWWTNPDDIYDTKRIATIVVEYGCNACQMVEIEDPHGTGN